MYFWLCKMHLSHFIRKWITAILNQISLAMPAVFLSAQSTTWDVAEITPTRNLFNLDALAMYFPEVFT